MSGGRVLPLFLLCLTACGGADGGTAATARNAGATMADMQPGDWRILNPAHGPAMLQQCSRDAPGAGDSYWMPQDNDIARFETLLGERLTRDGYFTQHATTVRDTLAANGLIGVETRAAHPVTLAAAWMREYVGVVRDGQRLIYGNFGPRDGSPFDRAPTAQPRIACDGGPTFFGAEYAIDDQRITHIAYNGPQ